MLEDNIEYFTYERPLRAPRHVCLSVCVSGCLPACLCKGWKECLCMHVCRSCVLIVIRCACAAQQTKCWQSRWLGRQQKGPTKKKKKERKKLLQEIFTPRCSHSNKLMHTFGKSQEMCHDGRKSALTFTAFVDSVCRAFQHLLCAARWGLATKSKVPLIYYLLHLGRFGLSDL